MTAPIQQALADKGLVPVTHLADAGYADAELLVTSLTNHGIELLGPVRPDVSWQAKEGEGFDISAFVIDWETGKVACPKGETSVDWTHADPRQLGKRHHPHRISPQNMHRLCQPTLEKSRCVRAPCTKPCRRFAICRKPTGGVTGTEREPGSRARCPRRSAP